MLLQWKLVNGITDYLSVWIILSICYRQANEYYTSGVLNLLVTAYPQSKIVPLCVPPNQNCMPFAYPQIINSTQKCFFLANFLISHTPCDLFLYPRLRTAALHHKHFSSPLFFIFYSSYVLQIYFYFVFNLCSCLLFFFMCVCLSLRKKVPRKTLASLNFLFINRLC